MAGVVGVLAAYVLMSSVVYPKWLEPMFTIDDRVEEAQSRLDKLEEDKAVVDAAKWTYRRFLDRVNSFDAASLENDLRERLNKMIAEHELDEVTVSGGSGRLSSFGKSNAKRMTLTVDATGSLEGVVGFLRAVYELPHLVRVGNVAIYPSHSSRRKKKNKKARMQLRVPIEVLVLPQHKMMGRRLAEDELNQPESLVRHEGRNYALIWERTPFTEYVKLEPLVVKVGADVDVLLDTRNVTLKGVATGGDGDYTVTWTTTDGAGEWLDKLSSVKTLRPRLKTTKLFTQSFTLTITDGSENSGTAQIEVTVREKKKKPTDEKKPPEDTGPKRWQDGRQRQLVMVLKSRDGDYRHDEVMIYHNRARDTTYFSPGDEFDGGELLYVHPRGVIVRRQDEYFVYPIGTVASNVVRARDADDFPTLKRATRLIREALGEPDWDAEDDSEAEGEEDKGESSVVTVADKDETSQEKESAESAEADSNSDASETVRGTDGGTDKDSRKELEEPESTPKSGGDSAAIPEKGSPAAEKVDGSLSGRLASPKDSGGTKPGSSAAQAPSTRKSTGRSRATKRGSRRVPKGKRGARGGRSSRRPPARSKGAGKN